MRRFLFFLFLLAQVVKPPPTPSPGDGHCLKFWVPYGRYCYYVFNEKQGYSWPDARHFCQSFWSDLVSIHSRAELEFIRNMNYTKNHNIWIGLTRDRNCKPNSNTYHFLCDKTTQKGSLTRRPTTATTNSSCEHQYCFIMYISPPS
uniref:C-type lectin domain-containing protein n=1 Tax=Kryptolebias marmoratus TaxID=37003 RepID=A0A3Q3ALT1_KRYMA